MREHAEQWKSNITDLDLSSREYGGFSVFNDSASNYLGGKFVALHHLSAILISSLIKKRIEQINKTVVPNPNLDVNMIEINHEAMIAIFGCNKEEGLCEIGKEIYRKYSICKKNKWKN